jgi:hypothetical protein
MAGLVTWCSAAEAFSVEYGPEHSVEPESFFAIKESRGERAVLSMPVGTIKEIHSTLQVAPGASVIAEVNGAAGDCLHLRWVVPDDLDQHLYDVELRRGDKTIHRRKGRTRGFGARSFFFPFDAATAAADGSQESVRIVNLAAEPLYIESVDVLRGFNDWQNQPVAADDFLISLLVNDVTSGSMFSRIAELTSAPGVRKGFCTEIYFAARQNDALRPQLEEIRRRCEEHNLTFLPAVCSWWAGTPPVVRERLDFQQVCWSETDNTDEGQGLKDLLGEKWNIHYGLTTPNMWSNTPWQTMNSPELNAMRHRRVEEAVALTEEIAGKHIAGYIAENEPAYWAFEGSDHHYPVKRKNLSADYNPHTVADAKKDGVVLDPGNGLDLVERAWLLTNVARYNEQTIAAALKGRPQAPFYSHALLDYTHFPFADTGYARSYAEAAHVNNALLGIEMIWDTDMDALWRVREWGRWGCVNREECDRQAVGFHLATLRACYMMGGDLMNSYNWHAMGPEGNAIEYMNQFLSEVRNGGQVIVSERVGGSQWKPMSTWSGKLEVTESFPWFNELEISACRTTAGPADDLTVTVMRGNDVVAYARVAADDVPASDTMRLNFGDLAQVKQRDTLELHIAGGGGWEMKSTDAGPDCRLICNMTAERRRSQYVSGRKLPGMAVVECDLNAEVGIAD